MQRVLLVGPGGAGKSTFAMRLAQCTGLPLVRRATGSASDVPRDHRVARREPRGPLPP